jgi:two-component system phosphate regulon sensor histidine kinase PhoR
MALSDLAAAIMPQRLRNGHRSQLARSNSIDRGSLERQVEMLQREVVRLNQLLELKSGCLRLASHELARPLGVVKGYLSMLEQGDFGKIPEPLRQPLREVKKGAGEMDLLVQQLTLGVQLEDGAEVLQLARCRLSQLVDDAISAVSAAAAEKKIGVMRHLPQPNLEAEIDRKGLHIAVVNLLSNAIKYAPPRSRVLISAQGGDSEVTITVRDQGPGIPQSEAAQVFQRYYRCPRSQSQAPGLGLGLHIVKQIAELHGGQVTLDSLDGKGSTFTLRLPQG